MDSKNVLAGDRSGFLMATASMRPKFVVAGDRSGF